MNKIRTARILMTMTILLVIGFQVYWLHRLYQEEKSNLQQSADIIFRETMYRLQSQRFTGDSMMFRGTPGDLFMTDVISSVRRDDKGDGSPDQRKVVISLKSGSLLRGDSVTRSFNRDTILYVNTKQGVSPPAHIARFLDSNRVLNDTIPVKRIDSLYNSLLKKEGINLAYQLIKSRSPGTDSLHAFFFTKKIPVGLFSPVFYQAAFSDPSLYVWKKISMQLVLSLLLIVLTTLSFIFIYRNLVAQKKLTDIKNEFINNITHELKTPIATVNVALEALRNFGGLQSPEKTREYLDISSLELQRLGMLVDKVLKLSMFENKAIALQKEPVNMVQLVEQVIASMRLQFEKNNVKTTVHTSGTNFTIEADRLHMTSVLYNLLDNALKYGKEDPHIDVAVIDRKDFLELRVADNGIGIPAEYKERIFEQFFRVPHGDRHNIKGYGLGLSYVNHIVRQHIGFIEVETEVGKGSTFILKMPFAGASIIHYDKDRRIRKERLKL